jgi:O-antigen/teichoic acid export membrane protein
MQGFIHVLIVGNLAIPVSIGCNIRAFKSAHFSICLVKKKDKNILITSFPLFSASFIAQGVNFLTLLLLPLFYLTEDIGVFFVFSALGLLLGSLVSWRSFNAILISDTDEVANSNLGISFLLGGVTSLILEILILAFSPFWGNWQSNVEWIYFLPVYALFTSVFISFENFLNYKKRYIQIGYGKLIKASATLLITLLLGILTPSAESLIFALITGLLAVIVFQIWISGITWHIFQISKRKFKIFFFKYRDILTFNSSLAIISELNSHLPTILLSIFYGENVVAFYGLAQRFFSTPVSVWSNSIASVFGKESVERYIKSRNISGYFVSTVKKVIMIIIPFGVIAFLLAPWIFDTFLGKEWEASGGISRIIIPLIIAQNIVMPTTILYTILNHQKRILIFYLVSFFVRIILLFILPYLLFDINYIYLLMMFSFTGVLHYILYYRELRSQIENYETQIEHK